jgi:hypothetical protein
MAAMLLLAVLPSAWAQCTAPSNLPRLQIHVQVVEPKIAYHHDLDLFGLQKVGNTSERPPAGMIRLGLTEISDSFRAQYETFALPASNGYCVWLGRVDTLLGNEVMNVYVADEYPPDSCEYQVILAHENTHVRFNIETLRDWAPTIQAALVEAARRKFPAIFPRQPTREDLNPYLMANMKAVFDLMNQDMAKRNATIDTPENYARENAKCNHWSRHGLRLDHGAAPKPPGSNGE